MQNSFVSLLPQVPNEAETALWRNRASESESISVCAFAIFNSQHYWILKTKRRGRNFNSARYEIAHANHNTEREEAKRIHISVCKHSQTVHIQSRRPHSVECALSSDTTRILLLSCTRPAGCISTCQMRIAYVLLYNENWAAPRARARSRLN